MAYFYAKIRLPLASPYFNIGRSVISCIIVSMSIDTLPIHSVLPKLHALLTEYPSVILAAQPGAGKSTQVPLALLNAPWLNQSDTILILEPRRVAVKAIAQYLARQLGESIGQTVGYQIRNERKRSRHTRIEVITEGILTRRLQADPELSGVGLVIFDEFHERALHADLALLLCQEVQQGLRDDLRVLVMSATMDTQAVSLYLDAAPILECPGRSYPVDIAYFTPQLQLTKGRNHSIGNSGGIQHWSNRDIAAQVTQAVTHVLFDSNVLSDMGGDVLVFLPSQGAIQQCLSALPPVIKQHAQSITLHGLYGAMPLAQQEAIIRPDLSTTGQRIILATNIAETSVTIPNVTCVIDTGLEKVSVFDVKSGLSKLVSQRIAKSSADQRAGRAGRVQAGYCLRLWSEPQHNALSDFAPLAVMQTDLSSLVLDLSAWGILDATQANWLDAPPVTHVEQAHALNLALGAQLANGQISLQGKQVLALGIEPRLGAMLLHDKTPSIQALACVIAALLSERDIGRDPAFARYSFGVDLLARVRLVLSCIESGQAGKSQQKPTRGIMFQVLQLAQRWYRAVQVSDNVNQSAVSLPSSLAQLVDIDHQVSRLCAVAFADRIAKRRNSQGQKHGNNPISGTHIGFTLANGRGVSMFNDEPLAQSPWCVVVDCDGQNTDGRVYLAVSITLSVIQALPQVISRNTYRYAPESNKLIARKQTCIGQIVIQETPITTIPEADRLACFAEVIQAQGLGFLAWDKHCENWLQRVNWLAQLCPDAIPLLSHQTLLDTLDEWLFPYCANIKSIGQLQAFALKPLLKAILDYQQQQFLESHAPTHYTTPNGQHVTITYTAHQAPSVHVILQEMFGQLSSPLLAQGQVPLCFTLLSPARRPLQTTSDLAHFWRNSYFDVRKDMKGRYPKHRWPEEPLLASPGRSMKPKS